MADGRIVFQMDVDNSAMQKDLNDAKKQIDKATKDVEKQETAKLPLVEESKKLSVALDEAKRKLHELNEEKKRVDQGLTSTDPSVYLDAYSRKDSVSDQVIKQQEKEVADLQKQWEKVEDKIDACNRKIQDGNAIIDTQTARAGDLSAKLAEGGVQMSEATEKASKKTSGLGKRLMSLARSALVFSVITAGLTAMRNYMGKALKTNDEFTGQLAKLKGAMLTAFQPIYEFVVPALITLMRILTAVFSWLARLLSLLGGKTSKQSADAAESIYKEADALDAVGGAAKKAQKSLAGFDEINTLDTGADLSGGGGGGGNAAIAPDFSEFDTGTLSEDLNYILGLVVAVGTAFLTWKIARNLTADIKTAAGAALAVGGALMYAFSWGDAFTNGIDWLNLAGMIVGVAAAALGLYLIFGSTGSAIALLIGGVGMLVVGLKDFIETGELTNESLATIMAGILLVGGAISLVTGSWIPLLIAAVVGLVLLLVTRGDEVKAVLQRLDDWLQGVFAKDWTEVFGPVLGGAINDLLQTAKGLWDGLKQILDGIIDLVGGVFTGDWKKAWNGILSIINGVLTAGTAGVNGLIRLLNKLSFTVPDWVPGFGGAKFGFNLKTFTAPQIPYLAQGAVIPPNKPFMAMLGDQRHGTNIEAPLSTIQEAVAIVMEDMIQSNIAGHEATVAVLREILEAILGIEIGDEVIAKAANRYNARLAIMRGDI